MSRTQPLVALLTDFGLSDHYVASMKGVLLSISPSLHVVDISHEGEAHNPARAAYAIWASYRSFPKHTVFACVVDPGVGTSREIVIAQTGQHVFVAPQNGILDLVLWTEKIRNVTVVQLERTRVRAMLPPMVSNSFQGRDVFAPLAAHLAKGIAPRYLGTKRLVDWVQPPFVDESHPSVKARILNIDRFGNIITNVACTRFQRPPGLAGIKLGSTRIARWIENYDSAPFDVPCLIAGSSGLVEIVMKGRSAAAALEANQLDSLEIIRQ